MDFFDEIKDYKPEYNTGNLIPPGTYKMVISEIGVHHNPDRDQERKLKNQPLCNEMIKVIFTLTVNGKNRKYYRYLCVNHENPKVRHPAKAQLLEIVEACGVKKEDFIAHAKDFERMKTLINRLMNRVLIATISIDENWKTGIDENNISDYQVYSESALISGNGSAKPPVGVTNGVVSFDDDDIPF